MNKYIYKIIELIKKYLLKEKYSIDDLIKAHEYCTNNKSEIFNNNICGCFYCLKIFNPKEIESWLAIEETALCPYCGIDSVIANNSGYRIFLRFLKKMNKYWFKNSFKMDKLKVTNHETKRIEKL